MKIIMDKISYISKIKNKFDEFKEDFNKPYNKNRRNKFIKTAFSSIVRTIFLFGLCFVILFPTIQQLLMSFRAPSDINNPAVIWIPMQWSVENYSISSLVLDYPKALVSTFTLSFISMILQLASTALAGYAFSRLKFKGSGILFLLVVITIIVPPQAVQLPQYVYFNNLGLLGSQNSIYLMSGLGMGIRSGIFIYIFRSFFAGLPKELEESAQIDGAGVFRTFWQIMLPNARGAIITVGLFAFVWQWNDTHFASLFEVDHDGFPLLSMRLLNVVDGLRQALTYKGIIGLVGQEVTDNPLFLALITNVSALMMMVPLLIMYLFVQRQFVESIERTGIVG